MGSMQGLAALRDFEPADVAFGSKDEVSFHSRMSAFAGFRHWRPQSAVTSRPGSMGTHTSPEGRIEINRPPVVTASTCSVKLNELPPFSSANARAVARLLCAPRPSQGAISSSLLLIFSFRVWGHLG